MRRTVSRGNLRISRDVYAGDHCYRNAGSRIRNAEETGGKEYECFLNVQSAPRSHGVDCTQNFLSRSEIAMISEVGADRFLSVEKCIVGYRKLPRSSGPLAMVRKHLCAAYLLERHQRSNVAAASRG